MSYDSDKVPVYEPIAGYNHLGQHYSGYHRKLDEWMGRVWMQFLPRSIQGMTILDIGAGDGRILKDLSKMQYGEYIALDGSQVLLDQIQTGPHITTVESDLETEWKIDDHTIDVGLCFFTLGHLQDISHFVSQCARVMKPGSTLIIQYHDEPKPYIHHIGADMYKIQTYHHHVQDIVIELQYAGFQVYVHDMIQKNVLTSWLIICHCLEC